jgi:rhodanese-related sulfurtransferase
MSLRHTLAALSATLVLTVAALPAHASKIMTPETITGVKLVTAEQVQQALGRGAVAFDVRVAAECSEKTIKGAVCHTYREKSAKAADFDKSQDQFDLSKLPADKNAAVIFFCNSGDCWRSYKAAIVVRDAGWKNVSWFRGGMPEWAAKGLPTQ